MRGFLLETETTYLLVIASDEEHAIRAIKTERPWLLERIRSIQPAEENKIYCLDNRE